MAKKSTSKQVKKRASRSRTRKGGAGVPFWRQSVTWGLLLAVAAFVAMVMFGRLPSPVSQPDPLVSQSSEVVTLEDLRVEVESLLWRLGLQADEVVQQPSEGVIDLRLQGSFPTPEQIEGFVQRVKEISALLHLESYPPRHELRVFSGPALMVRLRFSPAIVASASTGPVVTIIMDDIGRNLAKVQQLLAIEQPVTLAILPSTPYAFQAAQLAYERRREVMVHIPMEPQGYPAIEPGSDALLLEHSEWEVKRRLKDMFKRVPHAVGGNNHMGSRYTEYGLGMASVGEFMREQQMFFVDSRTTGKTLAAETMHRLGVPVVSRDVFLDNNQDVDLIRAEIRRLVAMAKRHGRAVGICHPYSETLAALETELPEIAQYGVRVIPVREMLDVVQSRGN